MFPLTFWDFGLWLAITAIILLATVEFISPYHGMTNLLIEKKKLKHAALMIGTLFLFLIIIYMYQMVIK